MNTTTEGNGETPTEQGKRDMFDDTLQDKNSTESSAVKINPKILADAFWRGDGGGSGGEMFKDVLGMQPGHQVNSWNENMERERERVL